MRWIALLTLLLLAVFVGVNLWYQAVFTAYSSDFGRLTPAQFEAMNARMDMLGKVARLTYAALSLADLALIVVAARARAFVVAGVGIAFGVLLALFWLFSLAAVSASMIG